MNLYLNFYGTALKISSQDQQILDLLAKDFSYFKVDSSCSLQGACIEMIKGELAKIPSQLVAKKQTPSYLLYKDGPKKWIDYYGKALCLQEEKEQSYRLYSPTLGRLHEVGYLLILSIVTKDHDLRGLHKLHSFAVQIGDTALLGAMPMKGGKTSSFLHFLKNPAVQIISDDCPLIDRRGDIYPFPLRVGVENQATLPQGDASKLYQIDRELYGMKTLAPLDYFANQVALTPPKKVVLFFGLRSTFEQPQVQNISRLKTMHYLLTHMIAGVGLPMVIEFFLQASLKDYFFLLRIGASRCLAAWNLCRRASAYQIFLCENIHSNSREMNAKAFPQQ